MEDLRSKELEGFLGKLIDAAKASFGSDLVSVVLFGSAAENRLRPSSDVNLLWVLARLDMAALDAFREPLRVAQSAILARSMFLLQDELPVAAELFAVKFADMKDRHRLLHGIDILSGLHIDEAELRRRLREVLLNLSLRLRERYVALSLREEQLVPVIVEAAGPLRSAASALLRLRGQPAVSPREALETVAAGKGNPAFVEAVTALSHARANQCLPPGKASPILLALTQLASQLREALEHGE